jgi:Protein of unknown function (DUF1566)
MQFDRINKKVSAASIFVVALASLLLTVSVAQAECNFFTGWVDNKDGTVRDPRNGLIWKRCAEGVEFANGVCTGSAKNTNWDDAIKIAKQSKSLGKSDWRLPTKEEFEAVMDSRECENKSGEYAASKAIAHMGDGYFWSASPYVGDPTHVWFVDLVDGRVGAANRGLSSCVRLVRASQLLGGEAALEFVQEKADWIASSERQRAAEETRQKELTQWRAAEDVHQKESAQQRAVEMERQRIAEEAEERQRLIEQAQERKRLEREQVQERKKLAAFRKSLRDGDDTNCGPVIEVKGKLVKVAFAVANYGNEHWVKREQILSPDYDCRFVNGQYQSLQ